MFNFVGQSVAQNLVDHEEHAGRWKCADYRRRQTTIHAEEALLAIREFRQLNDALVSLLYLYVGFDQINRKDDHPQGHASDTACDRDLPEVRFLCGRES